MNFWTSKKEKRYWFAAALVLFAILATLAFGRPLQHMLRSQALQAVFFVAGMLLVAVAVLIHGFKVKPDKKEIALWIGLAAVYTMFVFRLGAPERSHLIEYSVLAIFIHKALIERYHATKKVLKPALIAFVTTAIIGVLDEGVQYFIPNRHFDPVDIVFNCLAALMAVGGTLAIQFARILFRKKIKTGLKEAKEGDHK